MLVFNSPSEKSQMDARCADWLGILKRFEDCKWVTNHRKQRRLRTLDYNIWPQRTVTSWVHWRSTVKSLPHRSPPPSSTAVAAAVPARPRTCAAGSFTDRFAAVSLTRSSRKVIVARGPVGRISSYDLNCIRFTTATAIQRGQCSSLSRASQHALPSLLMASCILHKQWFTHNYFPIWKPIRLFLSGSHLYWTLQ